MDQASATAWQPITPGGVARFAAAPIRRLLLVQLTAAFVTGIALTWFVYDAYVPVLDRAIGQLPDEGQVRFGKLQWQGDSPIFLAENRFLAISVDLDRTSGLRSVADVQFEFARDGIYVHSLLGYLGLDYPSGWIIEANRAELRPRWGAWQIVLLLVIPLGTVLVLLGSWWLLALCYAGPFLLWSYLCRRELAWSSSFKVCGAALLPGALLVVVALSCYDLGVMDLVQMTFVYAAHIAVGWIYLLIVPFLLPASGQSGTGGRNPFVKQGPSKAR